ncbi:uncharacterized protein LOC113311545 [Papaver somniferum]|uniref:uncharacterized protein LOC113311545 n=1 Tax=Papaver somniferum TaxID=3469 RepID=UPI000E6F96EB|nr:uncharacterized protein LOC113311545 [Papaver somniferum]
MIGIEPSCYKEAQGILKWEDAMQEELAALKKYNTWELVPKPKYTELVTSHNSWNLWHFDVKNTFIYGESDREIFMEHPDGFVSEQYPDYVCRLKKVLYDDMIITGDDAAKITRIQCDLSIRFETKNLVEVGCFLGIEVGLWRNFVFLTGLLQRNFTLCERYFGVWAYYKGSKEFSLRGFVNVDWAGNVNDRRSTTGYCFYIGSTIVSWCSKNQCIVDLSST